MNQSTFIAIATLPSRLLTLLKCDIVSGPVILQELSIFFEVVKEAMRMGRVLVISRME